MWIPFALFGAFGLGVAAGWIGVRRQKGRRRSDEV